MDILIVCKLSDTTDWCKAFSCNECLIVNDVLLPEGKEYYEQERTNIVR